jgi:hypothetical protein
LLNSGFENSQIATISPQNMTYSDKVYFHIDYEDCKALIINEVDKNFPKHNNLISFIDRNVLLPTKGSYIRNNFELIIVNSIYPPEEVFSYLGKKISSQILRRIFDKLMDCKVFNIFPNEIQISEIKSKNLSLSNLDFQKWYKPLIFVIDKPNYSLIKDD